MWAPVLVALGLLGQDVPPPVAGQPISFAADHDGACGSGWASSTIGFQLYVNGAKVGAEAPMSSTPGVVRFTVSGLSAGTHKVEATAICRGTLATGAASVAESARSAPLSVEVLPDTPPLPDPPLLAPKNVRARQTSTAPAPEPVARVASLSPWASEDDTDMFATVSADVEAGQVVLVTVVPLSVGLRTFAVEDDQGDGLTPLGSATLSATDSRGVHVWARPPAATAGPVTIRVETAEPTTFRASAMVVSGRLGAVWTEAEATSGAAHECRPEPLVSGDPGLTLCMVYSLSGSTAYTVTAGEWFRPTVGRGGWVVRPVEAGGDGRVAFTTDPGRRMAKVAVRVW